MGSVAWAEPATIVTSLANWDTTEMGADTCIWLERTVSPFNALGCRLHLTKHNKPFGFLDTVRIRLGISQSFPLRFLSFFDFRRGSVTDENGLASPLDDDLDTHI